MITDRLKDFSETVSILGKYWENIIAIIFMLLPGVMYQIQIKNVDIASFSNFSIILFLLASFYYALPFILLGLFEITIPILFLEKTKKPIDSEDFFSSTILSLYYYFAASSATLLLIYFKPHLIEAYSINFIYISIFIFGSILVILEIYIPYYFKKIKNFIKLKLTNHAKQTPI